MYFAFLSYKTRVRSNNSWSEGYLTMLDISEGVSTSALLTGMLEAISTRSGTPLADIVPISFNVLPATVGGHVR